MKYGKIFICDNWFFEQCSFRKQIDFFCLESTETPICENHDDVANQLLESLQLTGGCDTAIQLIDCDATLANFQDGIYETLADICPESCGNCPTPSMFCFSFFYVRYDT